MGLEDKRDELMGRRFIDGWMMEGNLQIYVVFYYHFRCWEEWTRLPRFLKLQVIFLSLSYRKNDRELFFAFFMTVV